MPPLHPLHAQLTTSLQNRHNIPVSPQWLNQFLTSRGPTPPPVPALLSTAHFRILASDITTSILPTTAAEAFPNGISDVSVKERLLAGNVVVQVLDVLDVGSSKWSQIEAMERVERGEEVRGREVIRAVAGMDDDDDGEAPRHGTAATQIHQAAGPASAITNNTNESTARKLSTGPYKLLLQDAKRHQNLGLRTRQDPQAGYIPLSWRRTSHIGPQSSRSRR